METIGVISIGLNIAQGAAARPPLGSARKTSHGPGIPPTLQMRAILREFLPGSRRETKLLNGRLEEADLGIVLPLVLINGCGLGVLDRGTKQNELRIEAVACRLIDRLPRVVTRDSILVVVVGAEFASRSIRGEHALLVEHHES